jgi:hypothetical protein
MIKPADDDRAEIWFINRGYVLLRPKEPFVQWVQSTDPRSGKIAGDVIRNSLTGYLIPEFEFEEDSWHWIRQNCAMLFELKLQDWYIDETVWPADRSWPVFTAWFEVEFVDVTWDLVDDVLSSEPPPLDDEPE